MLEPVKIEGKWWLPEAPEEKYSGTMTFSQMQSGQLTVYGSFEGLHVGFDQTIILGQSTNEDQITLYKCICISTPYSNSGCSYYFFHILFSGMHFLKEEDILFSEIDINYSNLEEWYGKTGLSIRDKTYPNMTITYRQPKQKMIIMNDEIQLGFKNILFGYRLERYIKNINIHINTFVAIRTTESLTFNNVLDYVQRINNFITLATGKVQYPQMIFAFIRLPNKFQHLEQTNLRVSIFYQMVNPPSEIEKQYWNTMLFMYSDISNRFKYFMKNWLDKSETLRPFFSIYFSSLNTTRMFIDQRFISMVQALEIYHRLKYKNRVKTKEEHEMRVNRILSVIPKHEYQWVEGLLRQANQPSLRMRLWEIFEEYPELATRQYGHPKHYVKRIVEIRNDMTHYSKKGKPWTTEELVNLIKILKSLIETILLVEMGFSKSEAYTLQEKQRRYDLNSFW